jgi:hypothetical protein
MKPDKTVITTGDSNGIVAARANFIGCVSPKV